ncbi:MAG: response regulator [Rhodospirillaceae bacterium]|nr:response regulator [Rhodospirillaceae bacterium]
MSEATVFVVDDDPDVRDSLAALLSSAGLNPRVFDSATAFLAQYQAGDSGCLVADIRMPDMDGIALQTELTNRKAGLPVIIVTGHGDVPLAVRAMKAGAMDFIEKPFDDERLLESIQRGLSKAAAEKDSVEATQAIGARIATLTPRELEVLELLIAGHPNKVVGHHLDISPRTVEVHRGRLMDKMQARNLSDLVRMALAAGIGNARPASKAGAKPF